MSVEFSQQREKLNTKHTHPAARDRERSIQVREEERIEGGCEVTLAVIQTRDTESPSELPAPTLRLTAAGVQQCLAKLNTLVLFCDKPQH